MDCNYVSCQGPGTSPTAKFVAVFRCAQCKQVNYCSKNCQASDWKYHKRACRAWKELSHHVMDLPLELVHQRFQQTQVTIAQLESVVTVTQDKQESIAEGTSKPSHDTPGSRTPPQKQQFVQPKITTSSPTSTTTLVDPCRPSATKLHPDWHGSIEEMAHLNSYQITLKPVATKYHLLEGIDVEHDIRCEKLSNTWSSVLTVGQVFSWTLDVLVQVHRIVRLDDCFSIRLQCLPDAFLNHQDSIFSTSPINTRIERLECKACHAELLSDSIDRVVPLPSGYWDEITDYIICYPGDVAVNFGTTTVPLECAWEDASVYVLHPESLGNAVSILNGVEPYGTTQSLSWQPEGRQVETISCSFCCSPLGIKTNQGCHLYKHRLTSDRSSVTIFVANELKRYAESQAIFTFVVCPSSSFSSSSSQHGSATSSRVLSLLLHVVSWDSILTNISTGHRSRVVKVIYEESTQLVGPSMQIVDTSMPGSSSPTEADFGSWTWGGLDLCCNPGILPSTKQKSVILTLDEEEWNELILSIKSEHYCFAQQVVDATILVKLGAQASKKAGLTAMTLY